MSYCPGSMVQRWQVYLCTMSLGFVADGDGGDGDAQVARRRRRLGDGRTVREREDLRTGWPLCGLPLVVGRANQAEGFAYETMAERAGQWCPLSTVTVSLARCGLWTTLRGVL